jgi:hypothetical protein
LSTIALYYRVRPTGGTGGFTGNGTSGAFIWGAQLNIGSTALPYQKTETRLNIPRLDYSNGTCPSLLVEPQRTNLALYSEQFDNAYWQKITGGSATAPVVTANYSTSPDGTKNADRLQCSRTGTGSSDFSLILNGSNIILSATGTATIWMKSNTSSTQNVLCYWGGGQGAVFAVTTEWQRFTLSGLSSATNAILFGTRGGSGNFFNGGDTAIDVSIWGAQVESGDYSTSYIPTTSASVTRNADVISKTGISSLIGQTEGTFFTEFYYNGIIDNSNARKIISFNDGSSTNLIDAFIGVTGNTITTRVRANDSSLGQINSAVLTQGFYKIAYAYKNSDFVLYVNGVQAGSVSSGTISFTSAVSIAQIGDGEASNDQLGSLIKAAALWKTRLTNDQLTALTTL